jgi:CubicO group peptidase (beta-lactamase class C family)
LPVDPDTVFVVGSVTKTFTATAVMRLVADGKVELTTWCAITIAALS